MGVEGASSSLWPSSERISQGNEIGKGAAGPGWVPIDVLRD